MKRFTRTLLLLILPEGDGSPVQSGAGAVCEGEGAGTGAGAGAGGGDAVRDGCPCGGVDFGVSLLCTGLWPRRDLTLLDCLWPSLDFTPVLDEGVDGCLKSGELAYGLGGKSGVGSGRCATKLGFLPVELVELALLEAEEVEGAGELKVTFFAGGGEIWCPCP